MSTHKHFIIPALIAAISVGIPNGIGTAYALKNNNSPGNNKGNPPSILSGCTPGAAQTDLDINNVRARMLTGGDMWWDYSNSSTGRYEVPKGSGLMPIYAGALWIGGYDVGKNLHLAGQEYRSGGNDWWPGPLDTIAGAATITPDVCQQYDHHYKITQSEVASFVGGGAATSAITKWPGNGNTSIGQAQYLAPFFDKNGDGIYNPGSGDYPGFDLVQGDNFGGCQVNSCIPVDQLFGDECLWWVINDKGNIHTNTTGSPMGLEVHCQAFGFFTDDEINNMTFINYRIYNRSSDNLDSAFIGIWCDPDLGCATDDFVGCDVSRGLGYVYNGTNNDVSCSGELGYGQNPPACGIDFFRGPIATPGDGTDNDHDCSIDEDCEQAIMAHFVYFNNGGGYPHQDPSIAKEYYNYLSGTWQDGTPFLYGGAGYPPSSTTKPAAYCFPVNSDHQYEWGTGGNCQIPGAAQSDWSEETAGNTPDDRRFVESAGPFKLLAGSVNVVTAGVVWARATSGGAMASVGLMKLADDKAQKLFDNCFQVLNGPDAPDLTIQELDKKLILYISNKPTSNNYQESYTEYDPTISMADSNGNAVKCIDTLYHFEGYKIYQLKDGTVSSTDLNDANKARLLAECDVKNGISTIINYVFDQSLGASVPTEEVTGADNGIFHSLTVTTDLFASGDPTIINHKTYYYTAIAYGYNQYKPYKQDVGPNWADNKCPLPSNPTPAFDGQKKPYKQGRRNIMSYSAIPHISTPYTGGTQMQSAYGDMPAITRVEGNGNGGMVLDFTSGTVSDILASSDYRAKTLHYVAGSGPLNVRVVDPLNVPVSNNFTIKFDTLGQGIASLANANWTIINNTTGDSVVSGAYLTYNSPVGTFSKGETVKGSSSNATGTIISYNTVFNSMKLTNIVGTFTTADTIKGSSSNAKATVKQYKAHSSDKVISTGDEKLLLQWGLAVAIKQIADPGSASSTNNGFLEASMSSNDWLTGLADVDGETYENWIRSGTTPGTFFSHDNSGLDDNQVYEGVIGGTWAPYRLCAGMDPSTAFNPADYYTGPHWGKSPNATSLKDLASVNVVFTSDKNLWSRCVVFEMCEDTNYTANTIGSPKKARKLDFRRAPSVDKNGNSGGNPNDTLDPNSPNYISATGMGWFPGYAINLETGERLNIAFGENSALALRQGAILEYNLRSTITYSGLFGTFAVGEKITSYATPSYTVNGTANIVSNNPPSMVVESIVGAISPTDVITGAQSNAKATVTSFPGTTFQVGDTVTGGTSGATAKILADYGKGDMNISNITGTFVSGELITGSISGAVATCSSFTPYSQNDNGADMLWNPTSKKTGPAEWSTSASAPVFGGQHYIYVFGHNRDDDPAVSPTPNDYENIPRYDAGKRMRQILGMAGGKPSNTDKTQIFADAMWVNIPLLVNGHSLLESSVTVRLRVGKPYKPGYSPAYYKDGSSTYYSDTASVAFGQNRSLPMYTFGTDDLATQTDQHDLAVEALDLISVVPNPYYAYSAYETNSLDNRVKITNLPEQCTISIYNMSGALIRTFKKGEEITNLSPKSSSSPKSWHDGSLDWDMKNISGTPVSSGIYIIHVNVPGVGEKIIKWFGIMRPMDLDSF